MGWKITRRVSEGSQVSYVPINKIRFSCFQPRFKVGQQGLEELAASIKEVGVIQPVVVRLQGGYYELVAGERRVRASQMAGLKQIPAVIRQLSNLEAAEFALIENLQRQSLHFFEEAEGYARLIAEFNLTQSEVAKKVGLSQSAVANKLRLLRLSLKVRTCIYELKLSERHARALMELEGEGERLAVLERATSREYSVREWEDLIKHKKGRIISQEIKKGRKKRNFKPLIKDLRLFINSLERGVETLRAAGLEVHLHHQQVGNVLKVVIEVKTD